MMKCINRYFPWMVFFFIYSHLMGNSFAEETDAEKFSSLFSTKFIEYFDTGLESSDLENLKRVLLVEKDPFKLKGFPKKTQERTCLLCHSIIKTILDFYHSKRFNEIDLAQDFLKKLCFYTNFAKPEICQPEVKNYFPFIKFILENRNLTTDKACDCLLQGAYCFKSNPKYEGLNVERPILLGSKKYHSNSQGSLKILQLSDFHYDPYYEVGSAAKCGNWICCRGPKTSNATNAAGKWGDYPCDTPSHTVRNIIQDAAKRFSDVDAIYVTGDFVDHFDWTLSTEECVQSIQFVSNLIKEYFPNKPVFPILGNHDIFPANLFAPNSIKNEEISSEWLYKNVSNIWKDWLPKDALLTLEKGGYYTTKLRPNLRIIALNSNVCFNGNIWLLYDNFFFRDQLEWLHQVLQEASNNNEKVHILSHVASNDVHCYRTWTKEFKKIIERFTHTVSAQFNGHSHLDDFLIFYASENSSVALNVAWNGGGGTTFPFVQHNYKVYYVNDHTYDVTDSETWTFDLKEANSFPEETPQWFKEYSFKSNFDIPDLSPDSLDGLVKRMNKNDELLQIYRRIRVKQSEEALKTPCDRNCLDKILSSIKRSTFDDDFGDDA